MKAENIKKAQSLFSKIGIEWREEKHGVFIELRMYKKGVAQDAWAGCWEHAVSDMADFLAQHNNINGERAFRTLIDDAKTSEEFADMWRNSLK